MQETAPQPTDLEMTAAQLKAVARTRALADEQQKPRRGRPPKPEPVEMSAAPEPRKIRRQRRAPPRTASSPELALRRAIAEHEREIKRLTRALRAIGAA